MLVETMIYRIVIIMLISFLLWLEREHNQQPAWLRTHILIWIWSTLLMILSIHIAWLPWNINWDPWRIAAQVVTWIWFIWAWAIMKLWLDTKWITTAANIWATSAIWLLIWAWMYSIWIIASFFILFTLVIITKFKKKIMQQSRFCNISLTYENEKKIEEKIKKMIYSLPIEIKTQDVKETNSEITIKIMWKLSKNIDIYTIKNDLKTLKNLKSISVSENFFLKN